MEGCSWELTCDPSGIFHSETTVDRDGPCDTRLHLKCRAESKDGSCIRQYPKEFVDSTRVLSDGYPEYRRRGRYEGRDGDRVLTDEWVIPHNPYLLERYRCHINVEAAGHIRSCKYVYK